MCEQVREDVGKHHQAQSATAHADSVVHNLADSFGRHELEEHLDRIEGKLDASFGLGAVRLRVRLLTADSLLLYVGVFLQKKMHGNEDAASLFEMTGLSILVKAWHPELLLFAILEVDLVRHLLLALCEQLVLEIVLPVFLVQD